MFQQALSEIKESELEEVDKRQYLTDNKNVIFKIILLPLSFYRLKIFFSE